MPWSRESQCYSDNSADPQIPPSTAVRGYTLPTDVSTLHSMIHTLLELQATTSVNTHLAASLARLHPVQAPPTLTAPVPCPNPAHTLTTASGRGAGSPTVFQQLTKTNWHGRLGRTHMVDVDALSPTALTELDCLLRRKLHAVFPRGQKHAAPDADTIFASLAALGLRLEDRGGYADVPNSPDSVLLDAGMVRRGEDLVAFYYAHGKYENYWRGLAVETLVELAKYRGLFNEEGFLRAK